MNTETPTPRTDAEQKWTFGDNRPGMSFDCVTIEFARQLERELAASHAREHALRDSLESIKEYWNHAPESAVDAIETAEGRAADALTLPPPPVVSKAEYDKLAAELEAERQDKATAIEIVNRRGNLLLEAKEQLAAAEQDAERLAGALDAIKIVSGRILQHIPEYGFEINQVNAALAAHEARKNQKP